MKAAIGIVIAIAILIPIFIIWLFKGAHQDLSNYILAIVVKEIQLLIIAYIVFKIYFEIKTRIGILKLF